MIEKWRPVPTLESFYEISNLGRIKSLERSIVRKDGKPMTYPSRIKKQHFDKDGYKMTSLTAEGIKTKVAVHRLVAIAFIPNPDNYPQVNHKDGNKVNNCVDNLEWCNASQNNYHAYRLGLASNKGEKNGASKLTHKKVEEIRTLYKTGRYQYKEIGELYGVTGGTVSAIVKRRLWKEGISR